MHARFGEHDLASILTNTPRRRRHRHRAGPAAGETRSLAQGTGGWAALGGAGTELTPHVHHRGCPPPGGQPIPPTPQDALGKDI